jgi:hypothetical protein
MAAEKFCPKHGHYDGSYRTCPYCSGEIKRPPAPKPLSEDDLPTVLDHFQSTAQGETSEDDLPTIIEARGSYPRGGYHDHEAPMDYGLKRSSGKRFLDIDDEEEINPDKLRMGEDITELDQVCTGMLGILWVKDGNRRGHIYNINDNSVVGRREGDLILDDPKVSNPHAKFTIEDGQFILWDFGSRNGTFVNGERIRAATLLKENDKIKIGDSIFILKILE